MRCRRGRRADRHCEDLLGHAPILHCLDRQGIASFDGSCAPLYNVRDHHLSNLNAWFHSCLSRPGMHHSIHNGSMALAASTFPMSVVSQPNCSSTPFTILFADSSFPQMNMVGLPALNCGFTIR